MPTINGTFIGLHNINKALSPYINPLEFREELCLADCVTGGNPPFRESYIAVKKEEIIARLKTKGVLGKLFLVESNSAHNMSYFLSRCAYEQLSGKGKFLIVNFDQHEDFEGLGGDIFCGNWGANICNDLKCDYLIIGRKTAKDALLVEYNEVKPTRTKKDFSDIPNIINVYNNIYLTVDMDVLSSADGKYYDPVAMKDLPKRTNWLHGDIDVKTLCNLLGTIPSKKIIAADITGFPPKKTEKENDVLPKGKGTIDIYIQDIETVAEAVHKAMT